MHRCLGAVYHINTLRRATPLLPYLVGRVWSALSVQAPDAVHGGLFRVGHDTGLSGRQTMVQECGSACARSVLRPRPGRGVCQLEEPVHPPKPRVVPRDQEVLALRMAAGGAGAATLA